MKWTHCRRGHDMAVVGRSADGRCLLCKRTYRQNPHPSLLRNFLPVEPLFEFVPVPVHDGLGRESAGVKSALPEHLQRAYWRAVKNGRITIGMADEIAVALGWHPMEIWGDAWLEDTA